MPMKSRRYKKTNKSRRTRKNKTTRRYKKQMRGGEYKPHIDLRIMTKEDLNKSFLDENVTMWVVSNSRGRINYFKKDMSEKLKSDLIKDAQKAFEEEGSFVQAVYPL